MIGLADPLLSLLEILGADHLKGAICRAEDVLKKFPFGGRIVNEAEELFHANIGLQKRDELSAKVKQGRTRIYAGYPLKVKEKSEKVEKPVRHGRQETA